MTGQATDGLPDQHGETPRGVPRFVEYVIRAIDFVGCAICAGTLAFLFAAILINVILRYLFGTGIVWAYEIHALLLPWLVAGGVTIASTRGRHIAVTLMPAMVSGWARYAVYVAVHLAVIAISVEVVLSSQPILRASQFQSLASLGIKQVWGYASIPAAFGVMALVSALELLRLILGGREAAPDPSTESLS
ncbi:TRAP transporter small permease [Fulvimarina endophytica]|uniref:TRAP transporter small permease protein n=1 Tax=Fulvimarina endophytica TaxID=2293836 RepID=A0A371X5A5_9HYPH|nr:TRAP transporter small permease subunit [Fulvimarina endophytica]RFC64401.1 TRAP transporter small permease [Fulvimarina endophytica]